MKKNNINPASFRDPSGFIFTEKNVLYRQVNKSYKKNWDDLISTGLYKKLITQEKLIPHQTSKIKPITKDGLLVLKPELVPFISYPYEWSFSQLKDAALLTLSIQRQALLLEMTLKDASAYNIQFHQGKPILIDTLSFEQYSAGKPWVAYRQFCQHFYAPLVLMSQTDFRLQQLLKSNIDGIPLDLASKLLPKKTYLDLPILTHIHLHARSQQRYASTHKQVVTNSVSKNSLLGIIDNLESSIRSLKWHLSETEWGEYYDNTNYSGSAFQNKKKAVLAAIKKTNPKSIWDLGANTGVFSRLISQKNVQTLSFDIDPIAVEKNYRLVKENKETNLLPLIFDFTNPSPAIGWRNQERMDLTERGPADLLLALAIIHHLAISDNLPLEIVAEYFAEIGKNLVIEFVPKEDSQVQKLFSTREDIFPNYTKDGFEKAFSRYFKIINVEKILKSKRYLYTMKRK